ncbi:hypothetical protein, partial [Methylicorpusculum sp.]|uniref:hypothetical protein n=1 Tax=Methylicorpusculum sp. TaxID=2713644 RepID=UPI002ABCADE8
LAEGRARQAEAQRQHDLLVTDHRIVLELVRIEIEKEANEGKVFIILSTHHIECVHADFLNRIECPIVEIKTDVEVLARIFVHEIMQEDTFLKLKAGVQIAQTKCIGDAAVAFGVPQNGLDKLDEQSLKQAQEYMRLKQKNDAAWFEQKDYVQARSTLHSTYDQMLAVCKNIMSECDLAFAHALHAENKEYYMAIKAYMLLYTKRIELRRLIVDYSDFQQKVVLKIAQNPTNRATKVLATRIVHAAELENGGRISKELLLRFLN